MRTRRMIGELIALLLIFGAVAVIAALFPYAVEWVLLFGGWLTPSNN